MPSRPITTIVTSAIAAASGMRSGERTVAIAAIPNPIAGAASAPTGIRLRWTQ